MKCSREELFIDMAVDRFLFKCIQITLFLCFTIIPKTGMGQL